MGLVIIALIVPAVSSPVAGGSCGSVYASGPGSIIALGAWRVSR